MLRRTRRLSSSSATARCAVTAAGLACAWTTWDKGDDRLPRGVLRSCPAIPGSAPGEPDDASGERPRWLRRGTPLGLLVELALPLSLSAAPRS